MTTLADLVTTAPAATRGVVTQAPASAGVWRLVVELADPAAGVDVEWYDITTLCAGIRHERGADQPFGRYAASVAELDLYADADELAPWNIDTSATFGTHVELGPGLLVRCGLIRVVAGTVAEWLPRFTLKVEEWGDATLAWGQIRLHRVVARDLLSGLVGVPIAGTLAENWSERIPVILTAAGWPYGHELYGATFTSGAADVLTVPARDPQASARTELDATCDPAGLRWYTDRRGVLIVRPQLGDTFHADQFTAGASGTAWTDPPAVEFHYNAEVDDGTLEWSAYAPEADPARPFGVDRNEEAVINRVVVTGGGAFDDDDPISAQRFDPKVLQASWIADNDQAAADLLNLRAYATLQARPVYTELGLQGFMPRPAGADWLDPVTVTHQTAPGRAVLTVNGWVRRIVERILPLTSSTVRWSLEYELDLDQGTVDNLDELNPPEALTVTADDVSALAEWTNPTQPIGVTHLEYRLLNPIGLWQRDDMIGQTAASVGGLAPSTSYTFQVRYLRIVAGIITHVSPAAELTFSTDPAATPIGAGGNTGYLPPADPGCTYDWKLQSSPDLSTWTDRATGDATDTTTVDGVTTFDLGGYTLLDNLWYRWAWREVCSGTPGAWVYGAPWRADCATPSRLSDPPYDDANLVLYVPKVCELDVVEAVTDTTGIKGAGFGAWTVDDDDRPAILSAAQGVVAAGVASTLDNLNTSDLTLAVRVKLSSQPSGTVTLFQAGAIRLTATASGAGWTIAADVMQTLSTFHNLASATVLDLNTWYDVAISHDTAGPIKLYVNGVSVDTATYAGNRLDASTIWQLGLPAGSYTTDAAAWDRVLDSGELPGAPPPPTYQQLLVAQGFTNYWSLQTARAANADEPDLIGSRTHRMYSGSVGTTTGPLGASDGANAVTFAYADSEGLEQLSTTSFTVEQDWSLSLWVKLDTQTGSNNILYSLQFNSTNYVYVITRTDRSGLCIQLDSSGSAKYIDFGVDIRNDGIWHHVVLTRDYSTTDTADTWRVYLDGVLKNTKTRSTLGHGAITAATKLTIGSQTGTYSIGITGAVAHVALASGVTIDGAAVSAQYAYKA